MGLTPHAPLTPRERRGQHSYEPPGGGEAGELGDVAEGPHKGDLLLVEPRGGLVRSVAWGE